MAVEIPNFNLIKLIGKGSYGEVWLARDLNHRLTDRYRAVKIVHQGDGDDARSYHREYEGVEQYEPVSREHAGLTDVLQVGLREDDGFLFYVMELADDCETSQSITPDAYQPKTLQHELETRGRLPFPKCAEIAQTLAEGLAFLHGKNLVHRDIKPANIIRVNGQWKFGDIGLVAGADEDKTTVGTLGYLPPEGSGRPAADIFSLGKVFYQMCTGLPAQEYPDLPADFDDLADPLFQKLNRIYLKACEYNTNARYTELAAILEDLSESTISTESTIHSSPHTGDLVRIVIVDEAGSEIDSFSLGNGEHIIGRKGHARDVPIDDKSVSRTHAKLIVASGQVEIEDLKSTYGTFRDGREISRRIRIQPSEKIQIGHHFIQLDAGGKIAPPPDMETKTLGDGRYTFLKKLGRGSFGEVWRMWDNELEEDVAAKLLARDIVDDADVADIKREVQKTRRLTHENIVRIHDFCAYPGDPPFLTMEFVDGHNLETHRLNRTDHLIPWDELKPWVQQLCKAVGYIHHKGIVHRDIKPSNILLASDGQLKLGDFGCARSMILSRYTMGQYADKGNLVLTGTLVYMSPQMLDGGEPDAHDDIYAIGVMLYELLTGQTPFSLNQGQEKLMEQIINAKPLPPAKVITSQPLAKPIPDHVSAMIMSCLSKDPTQRPGNAKLIMGTFH